jgi:hypothetical protein
MDKNLYPVFEIPDMSAQTQDSRATYGKSWQFDFETGTFVTNGGNRMVEADEAAALMQWCIGACMTPRGEYLAYSNQYGIDIDEVRNQPTRKAMELALERTITEAILINPRIDSVKEFRFEWCADGVYVSFEIQSKVGDSQLIGIPYRI